MRFSAPLSKVAMDTWRLQGTRIMNLTTVQAVFESVELFAGIGESIMSVAKKGIWWEFPRLHESLAAFGSPLRS